MKNRLAAGVVIGAIGLGIWLSQFWRGPGMGGGGAAGVTSSSPETTLTALPRDTRPAASRPSGGEREFLTILIHGDAYRVVDSDSPQAGEEASLEEIRRRVADVKGDGQGIRVRVVRQRDAVEGARADLLASLEQAGVKREAIQEQSGFVD